MSFSGDAGARPPQISFTALRTGETYYMPYVPETFSEKVEAKYSSQTILGMSHENDQFSNTTNHSFEKLSFYFKGEREEDVTRIHEGRKFLLSLCYPSAGAGSVRDGGPSRVLFIWPFMVTMTCKVESVMISHEKFNRLGLTTQFRAEIELSEIRDQRLTAEEVRENGTLRASDIGSQFRDLPTFVDNSLELRDLPEDFGG